MMKTKDVPIAVMVDVPDKYCYPGEDFTEAKYLQAYYTMQLAWDREMLQLLDARSKNDSSTSKGS